MGPPGAGKGTQAKRLAETLKVPHIASGDLFREHQEKNTELGRLAKSYMERGVLVPNEVTIRMILGRIESPDCSRGFVLDGFPRSIEQAQALEQALSKKKDKIDKVLFINVPEEELTRRLGGRLICRICQTPYHRESSPPKRSMLCDRCGGELYQRADDTPEAVKKRIQVYAAETAPLVEYYKREGILEEINGKGPIEQVGKALVGAVRD